MKKLIVVIFAMALSAIAFAEKRYAVWYSVTITKQLRSYNIITAKEMTGEHGLIKLSGDILYTDDDGAYMEDILDDKKYKKKMKKMAPCNDTAIYLNPNCIYAVREFETE